MNTIYSALTTPLQQARTRVDVFQEIFLVFLALGTIVGIVVVAYTLYNAYKYRDTGETDSDVNLPSVGELPTGGKGGKKLFLSFGISAIIVISLVVWTYSMLLYVEDPGQQQEEELNVEVTGQNFAWFFEYENGIQSTATLRVPADERVWLDVTSGDVWHAFGIPDQRVKADAIPGEYDRTWFEAEEAGQTHEIKCYELCGEFHTSMTGSVQVMEPEAFDEWMNSQLTMSYTVQDGNESPVTEGYELTVDHQERDFEQTYSADQFDENGTIEITELDYGGAYNVTLTSTDDQFESTTKEIDMTGPVSETFTVDVGNTTESDTNGNQTGTNDGGGN
ncbi:cytochrome c oxidase subunit II [Natrinema halophilum]|uniref:Cytochrome c oxidase subunit II n=1 Tax=Natrinema halophilum TaxID=1699371 RepID=A0A7D5H6T3_9EURY|nr:cytochrome c oxidase subunit II [Natrinema halophilum]QLG48835.1 cytochrome c oxidase subunit II [Natrinema halophilum]